MRLTDYETKSKGVHNMEEYTLQVVARRDDLKNCSKNIPVSATIISKTSYQPHFFIPAIRVLAEILETNNEKNAPSDIYHNPERKVQ